MQAAGFADGQQPGALSSRLRRFGSDLVSGLLVGGFVDPGGGGQRGRDRRPGDEALRRGRVGGHEDAGAVGAQLLGAAGGGRRPAS